MQSVSCSVVLFEFVSAMFVLRSPRPLLLRTCIQFSLPACFTIRFTACLPACLPASLLVLLPACFTTRFTACLLHGLPALLTDLSGLHVVCALKHRVRLGAHAPHPVLLLADGAEAHCLLGAQRRAPIRSSDHDVLAVAEVGEAAGVEVQLAVFQVLLPRRVVERQRLVPAPARVCFPPIPFIVFVASHPSR